MHPDAPVAALLAVLDVDWRQVGPGQWGLTVDCAGWPLHVGVALRGGLLRAQAEVLGPGRLDDHELLRRNRHLVLARFSHTEEGSVWIQGELPVAGLTEAEIDRLLGVLVAAATDARLAAAY